MDLLGCPMCNKPKCEFTLGTLPIEHGHIIQGQYVLIDGDDQYLLFTAGLQNIKLS